MIYACCGVKAASLPSFSPSRHFFGKSVERFTKLRNEEIFLAKCAGACAVRAFDLSEFTAVPSIGQFSVRRRRLLYL
jgi:hypothetical protein